MKTVDEIIAAIQKLKPAQFVRLQQKLERLEKKIWKAELARDGEDEEGEHHRRTDQPHGDETPL
jgi:uncharacterized protein YdcH (DUF465 family)